LLVITLTELPATCALEKADIADLEHEITDRLLTTEMNTQTSTTTFSSHQLIYYEKKRNITIV